MTLIVAFWLMFTVPVFYFVVRFSISSLWAPLIAGAGITAYIYVVLCLTVA